MDQAKQLTFTSKAGTPAVGMVLASDLAVFPVMFARSFGGDFITREFKLMPDPGAMEKALGVLKHMFDAGALPRSYATTKNDDQVTWMQQGRAAFSVLPFARFAQVNNKDQSTYPGRIKAVEFPISSALKGKVPMAAVVESWGMVIPANARNKDLSWSFIQEVSSKAVTTGAARNGNGPVRVSTYADPSFSASQPFATVEAQALSRARPAFPAFPEAVRAQAILLEEVQLAVLGRKPVKDAVAAVIERVDRCFQAESRAPNGIANRNRPNRARKSGPELRATASRVRSSSQSMSGSTSARAGIFDLSGRRVTRSRASIRQFETLSRSCRA